MQAKLHSDDGNSVYFYVYDYVQSTRNRTDWMGKDFLLIPEFSKNDQLFAPN